MEKKSILIVNHHGIGDNLMMTPSVRALKKNNPETDIRLLVTGEYRAIKDLWSTNMYVEEVISSQLKFHPHFWNPFVFYLKEYPLILNEAKAVAKDIKADKVVIVHQQYLPEFIEKRLPLPKHRVERIAFELDAKLKDFYYDIFLEDKHLKKAEFFLKKHNLGSCPLIALHTMPSNGGPRTWWLKEVKPFTEELHKKYGFKFILFHDKKSFLLERTLETLRLDSAYVFYSYEEGENEIDILTTAALLKKCRLAVTIDSAIAYLASAVSVPLVLLCHLKNTLDERKPKTGIVEGIDAELFHPAEVIGLVERVLAR